MSTDLDPTADPGSDDPESDDLDREELRARIDLLARENARLREEYARARQSQYRRTAIGLFVLGGIALLGALAFPAARTVLVALGAVGAFGAVLTYYLTPERFVAATVGEAVYDAVAHNGEALVSALGLADDRVYLPVDDPARAAVLFVPQNETYDLPGAADIEAGIVAPADARRRGVAFHPTGAALFAEFERALSGPLADEPGALADQLADGLVHQFELAASATPELDEEERGAVIAISGSTFGDVDRFDHPIASFLAVGLATGLDRPIEVEVVPADGREDVLVRCSFVASSPE